MSARLRLQTQRLRLPIKERATPWTALIRFWHLRSPFTLSPFVSVSVGIAVGGGVLLLLALAFCHWRRNQQRRKQRLSPEAQSVSAAAPSAAAPLVSDSHSAPPVPPATYSARVEMTTPYVYSAEHAQALRAAQQAQLRPAFAIQFAAPAAAHPMATFAALPAESNGPLAVQPQWAHQPQPFMSPPLQPGLQLASPSAAAAHSAEGQPPAYEFELAAARFDGQAKGAAPINLFCSACGYLCGGGPFCSGCGRHRPL